MDCPSEEQVLAYVDDELPAEARAAVDAHLGACSACARLIAASIGATFEEEPPGAGGEAGGESLESGGRVGRYIVLAPLGAGAMGVVYSAYDPELGRQVALKLLRPRNDEPLDARDRHLREARAMARLSHPNVVAVYDAGTWHGQVFIAMEFVPGGTLAEWRAAKPRGWREVIDVFSKAGRGLAAAHAAGLVHRDFKPENVLIGEDGSVRVTDFGLARISERSEATPALGALGILPPQAPISEAGMLVGSPGYMAPEQLRGGRADARSDLFSFCVALYESLGGERPFAGDTFAQLCEEVAKGRVRELPRSANVPAFVRRVLARGLRVRPEDRFPSMEALLRALEAAPATRRRRFLVALAATAALGLAVLAVQKRADPVRACRESAHRFAGLWDGPRRAEIHGAFMATEVAYAADAWQRVSSAFDRFATSWSAHYQAACELGLKQGEDDAVAYLRLACLSQQLASVQAKSDLFARADQHLVEVAAAIASGLDEPSTCTRAPGASAPPLPDRQLRPAVERVREKLVRVRSLHEAGRYPDALPLARAALAEASSVAWPPLKAEALLELAQTLAGLNDAEAALETAIDAALSAEGARHDEVAARAWLVAVPIAGEQLTHNAQARDLARHARAAIERLGGDDLLTARLLNAVGNNFQHEGKLEEGVKAHLQARALHERAGREDRFSGWLFNDEAVGLYLSGRLEESAQRFQRAAEIKERVLGPRHPDLGISLSNLGSTLTALKRYSEAEVVLLRASKILHDALKPEHYLVMTVEINLGDLAFARKDFATAQSWYQRAVNSWAKDESKNHQNTRPALLGLGRTLAELGQPEKAIPLLERALKLEGQDAMDLAATQFALARAQVAAGRNRAAARKLAEQARATYAAAGGRGVETLAVVEEWLKR